MADLVILTSYYIISAIELALYAGSGLYGYRLMRLTGSFRDWTLIIGGFLLTAVAGTIGFVIVVATNPDQVTSIIQSVGVTAVIAENMVAVIAALMVFLGVFGLYQRFKRSTTRQ